MVSIGTGKPDHSDPVEGSKQCSTLEKKNPEGKTTEANKLVDRLQALPSELRQEKRMLGKKAIKMIKMTQCR